MFSLENYSGDSARALIFAVVLGVVLLIGLAIYIAVSIIKMKFAKNSGAKLYGLVWLPIGDQYVEGQLADMYDGGKMRIWLPILEGLSFMFVTPVSIMYIIAIAMTEESEMWGIAIIAFTVLIFLIAIAYTAVFLVAASRVFRLKDPEYGKIWTILMVVLTLLTNTGDILYLIFKIMNLKTENHPKQTADVQTAEPAKLADE